VRDLLRIKVTHFTIYHNKYFTSILGICECFHIAKNAAIDLLDLKETADAMHTYSINKGITRLAIIPKYPGYRNSSRSGISA